MKLVICMLLVIALVVTPGSEGQSEGECVTIIIPEIFCKSGANKDCCSFLTNLRDGIFNNTSGPPTLCLCKSVLKSNLPATHLNECGLVSGSNPAC